MTQQERLVVSAYTGVLMTDFPLLHQFIEERMGCPIWTHEFADEKVLERIRERIKPEFLALCGRDDGKSRTSRTSRNLASATPPPAPPGTFQPFNPSTVQP